MSTEHPPPPRRPSQPHHSGSTSSTDFASLEQHDSYASGAGPSHTRPRGSSSGVNSHAQRRPSVRQRVDSAASSAPSTAVSDAPSRASTATKGRGKKPERPRPANLAGPTLERVPESFMRALRPELGRTGGSTRSGSGAGAGGDGGSTFSPSLSGDEAAQKSDGGKKPLWAIGGVFPKHQKRRRSTAYGREKGVRKGTAPPHDSGSDSGGAALGTRSSGGRGPARPAKLPYVPERGDDLPATVSDSTGSDGNASDTDGTGQRRPRAGTGDGVGRARPDPFEELETNDLQPSRRASSPGGVDERNAAGEDRDRQLKNEMRTEVGDEVEERLKKVHSGSSRTVAGEAGEKGEKAEAEGQGGGGWEEGDDNGDAPPEGAEPGRGGPNVGGELDQSAQQWAEDVEDPEDLPVRNWWGTVRYALREPLAEFLGAFTPCPTISLSQALADVPPFVRQARSSSFASALEVCQVPLFFRDPLAHAPNPLQPTARPRSVARRCVALAS